MSVDAAARDRPRDLRESLLERAESLPLGSRQALARLALLCDDPTATAHAVALEAARDEGFAALLLRLANSAYSASVIRVADLPTAVARLGLRLVQGLAVAAPGLRLLAGPNDGLGAARRDLHHHAVRTGLAARMLAPPDVDPEQALAAGLLHNVGLNVLALFEPGLFRLELDAARRGEQLAPFEADLLGFTHGELGALLAERWSYPLALVGAILDHDAERPAGALAAVVQVADRLVRETGVGVEAAAPPSADALGLARLAGLDRARSLLGPVLDAQARFEARLEAEPEQARLDPPGFTDALDCLL